MDAQNANLDKASEALQSFTSFTGKRSLAKFAESLDSFRSEIKTDLNDEEFKYVINALLNQRNLPGFEDKIPQGAVNTVDGFYIVEVK